MADLTPSMLTELRRFGKIPAGSARVVSYDGRSIAALRRRGFLDGENGFPRITAAGREYLAGLDEPTPAPPRTPPRPSSTTVSAFCLCGDSLTVSAAGSDPVLAVSRIVSRWWDLHAGGFHGRTDRRTAERARDRNRRDEARS